MEMSQEPLLESWADVSTCLERNINWLCYKQYFSAILKGKLCLKVGKYTLSKDTFHSFLSNKQFLESIRTNDPECLEQ